MISPWFGSLGWWNNILTLMWTYFYNFAQLYENKPVIPELERRENLSYRGFIAVERTGHNKFDLLLTYCNADISPKVTMVH